MASVQQLDTTGTGISNTREARYIYDASTGRVTNTTFLTGGQPVAETSREWDAFGRLRSISTRSATDSGNFHQSFTYNVNDANKRNRVDMADGSYWEYRYDDLGQVTSAKKHWPDGKPVAGQQFEYTFDDIGNRKSARYGGDTRGENLAEITYTNDRADPTELGFVEHPGVTYVTGSADTSAEVKVNGEPADRQGSYFSAPVKTDNSAGASLEAFRIAATDGQRSDATTRTAHIPSANTEFSYDADGNLLFDGRWHYEWNGENRLITMRSAAVPGGRKVELQFEYDYQGRRTSKRVIENIDGHQQVVSELFFIYDGWNVVAELDTTGRAIRTLPLGSRH